MDTTIVTGLTNYGPLGLIILAIMFGYLVPKPYVSKLEKENAFLKEDNRLKTEINRELTGTVANLNQLIGELRSLARDRQGKES